MEDSQCSTVTGGGVTFSELCSLAPSLLRCKQVCGNTQVQNTGGLPVRAGPALGPTGCLTLGQACVMARSRLATRFACIPMAGSLASYLQTELSLQEDGHRKRSLPGSYGKAIKTLTAFLKGLAGSLCWPLMEADHSGHLTNKPNREPHGTQRPVQWAAEFICLWAAHPVQARAHESAVNPAICQSRGAKGCKTHQEAWKCQKERTGSQQRQCEQEEEGGWSGQLPCINRTPC
ncbi:hypothetical protein JZ751_004619 [Albula glossodonta]|uniref:Uncharacterized protein n=1 Tax=Albula glossodonta TaxID=121402 RepID=A0A8T2N4Z8_9TELE|nr:hypothetical protein JZ751_004619 [Albula glossodonta]